MWYFYELFFSLKQSFLKLHLYFKGLVSFEGNKAKVSASQGFFSFVIEELLLLLISYTVRCDSGLVRFSNSVVPFFIRALTTDLSFEKFQTLQKW